MIKGIHEDKVGNEHLLKKELKMVKVKAVCSRFEAARVASEIISKGRAAPMVNIDAVGRDVGGEKSRVGLQEVARAMECLQELGVKDEAASHVADLDMITRLVEGGQGLRTGTVLHNGFVIRWGMRHRTAGTRSPHKRL